MKKVRFVCALGIAALLFGCASKPEPVAHRPEDSKALNIVRAAGMNAKLRDMEVPKDTVTSMTDSTGFGLAYTVLGPLTSPLNLLSWALSPEADTARNSVIAWMPVSASGKDPSEELVNMLVDAASKATKDMGYTPISSGLIKNNKNNNVYGRGVVITEGDRSKCFSKGDESNCIITFVTSKPAQQTLTPDFVGASGPTWFFDPTESLYSFFSFYSKSHGLNEMEFLVNTSKYLPEWVYFYVAPNKVSLNEKEKFKVPAVISQGKVYYFVKEKKN